MLRDLPLDFLSAKVAANVIRSPTVYGRSFRPALIGFLLAVRDGHPDTTDPGLRTQTPREEAFRDLALSREELRAVAREASRIFGPRTANDFMRDLRSAGIVDPAAGRV